MVREVNPVCDFFFGFMCTILSMDTVDSKLTLRTVHGIYIFGKDHTTETTLFNPWSKSVIPFPSLRKKIKAFKEETKGQSSSPWMPTDSTPPNPLKCPRKWAPGNVRTWWSNYIHRYSLIKTNRVNTLGTDPTKVNKISIIKPISQKACEKFGLSCSFCKQQAPHPLPPHSEWSSKDWDVEKAKAREHNSFVRFDTPMTNNPIHDSVDLIPFQGLTIQMNRLDKKAPGSTVMTNPPQTQETEGKTLKEDLPKLDPIMEEEKQAGQEIREHIEEAKYKLYMGQLSTEDSNLDMDKSDYPFLD